MYILGENINIRLILVLVVVFLKQYSHMPLRSYFNILQNHLHITIDNGLVLFGLGLNCLKPQFKWFKWLKQFDGLGLPIEYFLKYFFEQPFHFKPNSHILAKIINILNFEFLK